MKTRAFILMYFLLCCNLNAFAQETGWFDLSKYLAALENVEIFNGDENGKFEGNFVAILQDGSAWKIHPKDAEKFKGWNIGDILHVEPRTSRYVFKREHKFALINHTNKQIARVMLVKYPHNPLTIEKCLEYRQKSQDCLFEHDYVKTLQLSDSSAWNITLHTCKWDSEYPIYSLFQTNSNVYICLSKNRGKFSYFLVTGIGENAVWQLAE